MNFVQIKLDRFSKIQWPSICAMCGRDATYSANTSFTTTKDIGYYLVVITFKHQTYSIAYPVCRKHRIICNLLDHPARESLMSLAIFVLITTAVLWALFYFLVSLVLDVVGLKYISSLYLNNCGEWVALISFVLVMLYALGIFKPVKISNIDDDSIVIGIKNKDFFDSFSNLNRDKIKSN
ncbi:MAG: hypothetical protein K4571_10315 [Deltaproteobacteria bacterium]